MTCDCAELVDCQPLGMSTHPEWRRCSGGALGVQNRQVVDSCRYASSAVLFLSRVSHALTHLCTVALPHLIS